MAAHCYFEVEGPHVTAHRYEDHACYCKDCKNRARPVEPSHVNKATQPLQNGGQTVLLCINVLWCG